jgi:hypothetical protein
MNLAVLNRICIVPRSPSLWWEPAHGQPSVPGRARQRVQAC